jgi:hypothetical protein
LHSAGDFCERGSALQNAALDEEFGEGVLQRNQAARRLERTKIGRVGADPHRSGGIEWCGQLKPLHCERCQKRRPRHIVLTCQCAQPDVEKGAGQKIEASTARGLAFLLRQLDAVRPALR